MKPVREFFNEKDNCTDRRDELTKNNWLQQWL
jgi:[ribosomal protein S5]-alanine N-acetyltransferase